MRKSESEQLLKELSEVIAAEKGYDSRVVCSVIRHQNSFVLDAITKHKNIRLYKFGVFYMKNKYRKMLNDLGYVKYFNGTYKKYKDRYGTETYEEYLNRVEKSRMERSGCGEVGEGEGGKMCELSET